MHPDDSVTIESISVTEGECVLSGAWDLEITGIDVNLHPLTCSPPNCCKEGLGGSGAIKSPGTGEIGSTNLKGFNTRNVRSLTLILKNY